MTSETMAASQSSVTGRRSKLTPEREQEFFDIVLEQLREFGYECVTMEGVATQARCGKSTLYRQWRTKPRLVAAALRAHRLTSLDGIDTGSLAGDLRAAARVVGKASGRDTALIHALSHAVTQDRDLKLALREALVEPEVRALEEMLRRAVERGEVPTDHPALEFVPAQMLGILRVRPVLSGEYAGAEYLVRFVDAAVLPALGLGPGDEH